MRRAAKIDSNQNKIVTTLRRIPGVSVAVTSSLGKGFPDLVIGRNGKNYLIELKDGDKYKSQQKLTPEEYKWHEEWRGQVSVCANIDEVLNTINKYPNESTRQ